jgi:hypothetical protein
MLKTPSIIYGQEREMSRVKLEGVIYWLFLFQHLNLLEKINVSVLLALEMLKTFDFDFSLNKTDLNRFHNCVNESILTVWHYELLGK